MRIIYKISIIFVLCLLFSTIADGQQVLKGKVIDAGTKEPVVGASVRCSSNTCSCGCATNSQGEFEFKSKENCCGIISISSIGYQPMIIQAGQMMSVVNLQSDNTSMEAVVLTANRKSVKRSLAPVAISQVSSKMIQDAKPTTLDQVLNKVSGVYMVNLGNEQHSMSIRQPMTTKSLFLYLEDGIPIRTSGLFNHNALLEINMAAVKSIEVVKGPSSSLYGSEAIGGVVNFITISPTSIPLAKISLQGNNIGYRRAEMQAGITSGKWGFAISGYYAQKKNGYIDYTDFHKTNLTVRVDYKFNNRTNLTNSLTWLNYYSDMTGGIDSVRFANKSFSSNHTFTYRKVDALRYRSSISHSWNEKAKSSASLIFRSNNIGQNPAYSVKDDFRRLPNGTWTGRKDLAHGEINEAGFNSYALLLQHRQNTDWKNATVIGGLSIDLSPSDYSARYIRIQKDSASNVYTEYQLSDSMLTRYNTGINNYAAFMNFEFNPLEKLRVVASLRYDLFYYRFDNHLQPSSFSGSPDMNNRFDRISPKIGLTYNFSRTVGLYANYSEGFVPPQVTEMYRGVKVPDLRPSVFYNYEMGGWAEIIKGKLSADISIYQLDGTNEIVSVRLDDGSSQNMNAGKTSHKGVEIGMNASPLKDLSMRVSGAFSSHKFVHFVEKGISYNGRFMNGAPSWMHNAELWYKPQFAKGLRFGIEWQKIGNYYMDPLNSVEYEGYDVFHFRAGYKWKAFELWMNLMNLGNRYYAYTSSKSNFGYSYTPAEPRHFNLGLSIDIAQLCKKKENEK